MYLTSAEKIFMDAWVILWAEKARGKILLIFFWRKEEKKGI